MGKSLAHDVHESLVEARHQLVTSPPLDDAETWRGMLALRRASGLINAHAFGSATMILIRVVRARGFASSDAFADAATLEQELAVFDEAIAVAAARLTDA